MSPRRKHLSGAIEQSLRELRVHPADRRGVFVRVLKERTEQLIRLYSGMNTSMDQICAAYAETELELLADFLRRTADAGRSATDELAGAV